MPIRESLPAVLRGELAADLSPDSRAHLHRLADEAAAEGAAAWLRDECSGRLRQPHASHGVHLLLSLACARNGEVERAHQTLLQLGETLASEKAWEPLAAIAEEALSLETSGAAARLLARAHEGLGRDPARLEALRRAHAILPDDLDLGLLLVRRLEEAGQRGESRALLARLVPALARERRLDALEEAALGLAEAADAGGLLAVVSALPVLVQHGEAKRAEGVFSIAWGPVESAGRAGEAFATLRALVPALGPDRAEPFRDAVLAAVAQGPARELPDAAGVLGASGLADPLKPVVAALERWEAIARLPPGAAVNHPSFGIGRVRVNDGETVVSDFEKAPGQRMPYAAALRSLSRVAEDDLRVMRRERPDELVALRKERPAEVLVRALRALGGEAEVQKLKLFLTAHDLVPPAEWNSFLRGAKAAAEADPRIDHTRAFENRYRLAPEPHERAVPEGEDVALPSLPPRKTPRENLGTLRKFLGQHPLAEAPAARRFGRYVEGVARNEDGELADRARAALYLARWLPDRAGEPRALLRELWRRGLALSDLSGEDEQLALLEATVGGAQAGEPAAAETAAAALLSAADSRFSAVRERGAELLERMGEEQRGGLLRTLLDQAGRYPQAALRLIRDWLETGQPALEPWRAFAAALAIIEDRPKPSTSQKILEWIEAGGALVARLADLPSPDDLRARIAGILRQWRSSDRLLFPALEAAERVGLGAEADAVRSARRHATEKMFAQVGQVVETDVPLMTHATWERLKLEVERMERELRTTIPAAIQRARELGDLRENAEYEAAKHKQAVVQKQVAALQLRLSRARFIEDASFKDGVVGPGAEVVLESEDDVVRYWILGEGEQHHGEHVISHRAPVARSLIGKSIGEDVELGEGESRRRWHVVSVERRLPPAREPAS
jgi:transcription elongation factor GreA